jgi:hypothetical protein
MCLSALSKDDDDATVITSNISSNKCGTEIAGAGFHGFCLDTKDTIADSGGTQIFVMDGAPVSNKHTTTHPLKVALANGRIVVSTHICDITIDGLPTILMGHIIPDLLIASLIGICVLTDAGCTVTFDENRCIVQYNGAIILNGAKDPATYLWTLPLGSHMIPPAAPEFADARANIAAGIACFTHTVQTKANSIRFAHQSFCTPKISTLLKALWRGYLKGCPNLTAYGVTKYLNPSPTTAKGHMKRSRRGIRSTRTQTSVRGNESSQPFPSIVDIEHEHQRGPLRPQILFALSPNVIKDDDMVNMMINANLY